MVSARGFSIPRVNLTMGGIIMEIVKNLALFGALCFCATVLYAAETDQCVSDEEIIFVREGDSIESIIPEKINKSKHKKIVFKLQGNFFISSALLIKPGPCARSVALLPLEHGVRPQISGGLIVECEFNYNKKTALCPANNHDFNTDVKYYRAPTKNAILPKINYIKDNSFVLPFDSWGGALKEAKKINENSFALGSASRSVGGGKYFAQGFFGNDYRDEFIPIKNFLPDDSVELLSAPFYKMRNEFRVRILHWPTPVSGVVEVPCESHPCIFRQVKNNYIVNIEGGMDEFEINGLDISNSNGYGIYAKKIDKLIIRDVGARNFWVYAFWAGDVKSGVIEDSEIKNIGGGGIYVNSGDRKKLIKYNFIVKNNYIKDIGKYYFSGYPAIKVEGVGVVVNGNTIKNTPHAAIVFHGNDMVISENKIYNSIYMTGDAGVIYIGRDWTARGNLITRNLISGARGVGKYGATGIYLDDQASGNSVVGNYIEDVDRGILIGGGRWNTVKFNSVKNCDVGLYFDARGVTWQKLRTNDENWDLMKRLNAVPFDGDVYKKYVGMADIKNDEIGAPKYNKFYKNSYECGVNKKIHKDAIHFYIEETP